MLRLDGHGYSPAVWQQVVTAGARLHSFADAAFALGLTGQTHGATNELGGSFSNSGRSTLVEPDGTMLVVGRSGKDFGLARYTADGMLDTSFGAGNSSSAFFIATSQFPSPDVLTIGSAATE